MASIKALLLRYRHSIRWKQQLLVTKNHLMWSQSYFKIRELLANILWLHKLLLVSVNVVATSTKLELYFNYFSFFNRKLSRVKSKATLLLAFNSKINIKRKRRKLAKCQLDLVNPHYKSLRWVKSLAVNSLISSNRNFASKLLISQSLNSASTGHTFHFGPIVRRAYPTSVQERIGSRRRLRANAQLSKASVPLALSVPVDKLGFSYGGRTLSNIGSVGPSAPASANLKPKTPLKTFTQPTRVCRPDPKDISSNLFDKDSRQPKKGALKTNQLRNINLKEGKRKALVSKKRVGNYNSTSAGDTKTSIKNLDSVAGHSPRPSRTGFRLAKQGIFVKKYTRPMAYKTDQVRRLKQQYLVLSIGKILSPITAVPVSLRGQNLLSLTTRTLIKQYKAQVIWSLPFQYVRRLFFVKDLVTVVVATTLLRSSKLLSFYLARLLEKLPKHTWFFHIFNRVMSVFRFYCRAPISLKILIRGRINKKLRKKSVCVLRTQVALSTLDCAVDYSLTHSYTSASVLGIKVWVVSNSKSARSKTFSQRYKTY